MCFEKPHPALRATFPKGEGKGEGKYFLIDNPLISGYNEGEIS